MLSGFVRFVNERFSEWFGKLGDFLAPFLNNLFSNGGQVLLNVALDAVQKVAADPSILTDQAKRDAAGKIILDELKKQGISAAQSAVNSAIEVAVQNMKAKQAAVALKPSP